MPPAKPESSALLQDVGAETITPGKYVGDAACISCHKEQGLSYLHTSHHLTSQLVNGESVLGSFREGANVLTIVAPGLEKPELYFKMEARDGGYYQTAVTGWGKDIQSRSERMDIITGSGVRGATYLYWQGDRLYELPVSYWTEGHRWINSPGYTDGTADFSRPVNPGCLECHATSIQPLSVDPSTNRYEKSSFVGGISCERCHGPGGEHIALQKSGAAAAGKAAHAILNPATFSRDRQVDLCALCHNGTQREAIAPAFSYVPGRPLGDYFKQMPGAVAQHPDVHGNQVGLLQLSRCYLSSPTMSCSTCHDVHEKERPAASYSAKCLTCHQWQSCGISKTQGHAIVNNCIDCHMPVEPTNVIVAETAGKEVKATMRNHWIKIYPEAGKQVGKGPRGQAVRKLPSR